MSVAHRGGRTVAQTGPAGAASDWREEGRSLWRLWAPWWALGIVACVVMALLAAAISRHLPIADRLQQRKAELADAVLADPARGPAAGVASGLATPAFDVAPALVAADHASAPGALVADAVTRVDRVGALAEAAAVNIVRFAPDRSTQPAPAGHNAAAVPATALQVSGSAAGLGRFLHTLVDAAGAVELLSLRLTSAPAASGALSTVVFRDHDQRSLAAMPMPLPHPEGAEPLVSAPDPLSWAGIPAHAFQPLAMGPAPTPGAGGASAAPAPAAPSALPAAPAPVLHDTQAHGARLAGIIGQPGAASALFDLPATGALVLRRGEPLPGTPWTLVLVGDDAVTLVAAPGVQRVVALGDAVPAVASETVPRLARRRAGHGERP